MKKRGKGKRKGKKRKEKKRKDKKRERERNNRNSSQFSANRSLDTNSNCTVSRQYSSLIANHRDPSSPSSLLLLLPPSPRQGKSLFVVVVDRARPIRCIGSGLAAVCPARFLITPTTVVLRSSRGDTKPHRVFSTDDNSPGYRIVSRLIKVERAGFLDRGSTYPRLSRVTPLGKFIFLPSPLLLLVENSFYSWNSFCSIAADWKIGLGTRDRSYPRDIVYWIVYRFRNSILVIPLDNNFLISDFRKVD